MTATTERDAFLAAIVADPHDTAVRLVFADWLEDHGDAERAEFIRVQCELEDLREQEALPHILARDCPRCHIDDLHLREQELLFSFASGDVHTNHLEWAGRELQVLYLRSLDDASDDLDWTYRRGFVEQVSCRCEDWLAHGPAIVRVQPVLEVKLTDQTVPWSIFIGQRSGSWTGPVPWARGPHPGLKALPPLEE